MAVLLYCRAMAALDIASLRGPPASPSFMGSQPPLQEVEGGGGELLCERMHGELSSVTAHGSAQALRVFDRRLEEIALSYTQVSVREKGLAVGPGLGIAAIDV